MKTKEELEQRLSVLKNEAETFTRNFSEYGNIETRINDWEGRTIEFAKFEKIVEEMTFIERTLKFLF